MKSYPNTIKGGGVYWSWRWPKIQEANDEVLLGWMGCSTNHLWDHWRCQPVSILLIRLLLSQPCSSCRCYSHPYSHHLHHPLLLPLQYPHLLSTQVIERLITYKLTRAWPQVNFTSWQHLPFWLSPRQSDKPLLSINNSCSWPGELPPLTWLCSACRISPAPGNIVLFLHVCCFSIDLCWWRDSSQHVWYSLCSAGIHPWHHHTQLLLPSKAGYTNMQNTPRLFQARWNI